MSKLIDRWENLVTTATAVVLLALIGVAIPMCSMEARARDQHRLSCVQTTQRANDCKALFP